MESKNSRRNFLKTIAITPVLPVMYGRSFFPYATPAPSQFNHKFKLSLNVVSISTPLRMKTPLMDMLDYCARYNFEAIDPTGYFFPGYPMVPSDEYINLFKRKSYLLGIDISGTGVRNDFTITDSEKRKAEVQLVKNWIEVAAKLGSPNVRIFSGTTSHDGFTRDQVFDWMAIDIKECCIHGEKYGVMVALQNHNDFIKTADDIDKLFSMVNSEWFGLNLDYGSFMQKDPYQEIEQSIKHAITWQIKEWVWINGKKVDVDLERLFNIMKKAGYRGYLPLETQGDEDPFEKIPKWLNTVREALKPF